MTLSSFQLPSKKPLVQGFFLSFNLIESFKRDYFYPIFAEIYRRKGVLALADICDHFAKKTIIPSSIVDLDGFIFSNNFQTTVLSPQVVFKLELNPIFNQMQLLLNASIQKSISYRTSFWEINDILLTCLRFNCEEFYPKLLLQLTFLIKHSDDSTKKVLVEIYNELFLLSEIEIKNFRLIEKQFHR